MNQVETPRPRTPLRDRLTPDEWRRMGAMFGFIVLLHVGGVLLMWRATSGNYELADGSLFGWGTAVLAYTLGMRHAFDADHISAIDNTTRKLMSEDNAHWLSVSSSLLDTHPLWHFLQFYLTLESRHWDHNSKMKIPRYTITQV